MKVLKSKKRIDLKDDYFTLDFKTYAFFIDENGDVYTKEVGDSDVAKKQTKGARSVLSAPDIATFSGKSKEEAVSSLKANWQKQSSDYFNQEDKESPKDNLKTKERINELEEELSNLIYEI